MANKLKDFFTVIVSAVIIGTLAYTAVYLYQFYRIYEGFANVPLETYKDLLFKIAPIFIGAFLIMALIVSSKEKTKGVTKPISVSQKQLKNSNFYSLDLPVEAEKEDIKLEDIEEPPRRSEIPESGEEKVFSFKTSKVFTEQPPVLERTPIIEPVTKTEEPMTDDSSLDMRKIFSEDLSSDELDFLNRDTPEPITPIFEQPQVVQQPFANTTMGQPCSGNQNIQYIPVYAQPMVYQQGMPIYQNPYYTNQQLPPGMMYSQNPDMQNPEVVTPPVHQHTNPIPKTDTEPITQISPEPKSKEPLGENDLSNSSENGQINKMYVPPVDTPFNERNDFYERLQQEVEYSNKKKYEVSLILLNLEPKRFDNDFQVFDDAVKKFFDESAFIFEYVQDNTFAIILPFFSFFETQKELINLYDFLKKELLQRSTSFRAGFTSKFNRYVDSETILYETEVAFKKAIQDEDFCILGFEPDVNKYEQYYT